MREKFQTLRNAKNYKIQETVCFASKYKNEGAIEA